MFHAEPILAKCCISYMTGFYKKGGTVWKQVTHAIFSVQYFQLTIFPEVSDRCD